MDQNNRTKQLHQDSQTNLRYWKIIQDCNRALSSNQSDFQTASGRATNHLTLAQELSVANAQLIIDRVKSALRTDLYRPNPSTADNAKSSLRKASSAANEVRPFLMANKSSSVSLIGHPTIKRAKASARSARSSSVSASKSASLSRMTDSIRQSANQMIQASVTSNSANASQILSSQSQVLNSKVSSILTHPTSSSNDDVTVLPIKVRYYDIDNNQLVKKGFATGGYGQMINVTDLVPLPRGYRPYFYQKLYYNINSKPQTAIVFVTNHKMHLGSAHHQSIHNQDNSHKIKPGPLMTVRQPSKNYLSPKDFHNSSLRYLLIKRDLFTHSQKSLNRVSRKRKIINGEIVPVKRLTRYQNQTVAILPNGQYITARKDFVTVFKI